MSTPIDRVQLLKTEAPSDGGTEDDTGHPALLDPNEDAPEVQSVVFQPPSPSVVRDENVYVGRDSSGNLCFKDEIVAEEQTLNDLIGEGGALPSATQIGQVLYSVNGVTFTVQLPITSIQGWLINNDGIHLVVG